MSQPNSQIVPFARLADVQEQEPEGDRKCVACGGDGVLPVFNLQGEQCTVATCPICGGTRYAP